MKKLSNFLLSKDSLILTLFLVQFNLCAMYAQSYFGINVSEKDTIYTFLFWKALIISLVVSLAFASVTINVITRSKNRNDGYMFAGFDFLVYCSYYGNRGMEWYNAGLYGNILQSLLFAVITSVAILKLSELFLQDIQVSSKEQNTILELSNSNQILTTNIKELSSKLDFQSKELLSTTESAKELSSKNEILTQKLNELALNNQNLTNELQNKELQIQRVGAELLEYETEQSVDTLKNSLKGMVSQRTNKLNKGEDVTVLDDKITALQAKIQKRLNK
jgi:hypothetical protein